MKKKIAIFMVMASILVSCFFPAISVQAVPKTIQLGNATKLPGYVAGTYFSIKKMTNGTYVYCLNIHKGTAKNMKAHLVGEKDAGFAYIMANGYPNKHFTGNKKYDYYITQAAVWWYLDDTTGSQNLSKSFRKGGKDEHGLRPHIKKLVAGAKAARKAGYPTISMSANISTDKLSLSQDKRYYESEEVKVTSSNISSYSVTLNGAPTGTLVTDLNGNSKNTFNAKESFKIKVPVSAVSDFLSIDAVINATGSVYKAYEYQPSDKGVQSVIPVVLTREDTPVSATIKVNLETSKVRIIKLDKKTNSPISGAKLVVKDEDGNQVAAFISSEEEYSLNNLADGVYTIEEVEAPKGYEKMTEKQKFTVNASTNGQTIKVYNEAKQSVVTISKIDGSTKKPLAGAVLVVKDSTGNTVARFTTSEKDYVITDLDYGTYTVTEESAPNGYMASNEEKTFTITADNLSHKVTLENYPAVVVPDTDVKKSTLLSILGIIILLSGMGFVYKYGKKVK